MKKRFGIVIGGGDTVPQSDNNLQSSNNHTKQTLDTSITGFCSVDEGVDLLATRMSMLDHRIAHIEQHDLAARSSTSTRGKPQTQSQSQKSALSRNHKQQHGVIDGDQEDNSVDSLQETWTFAQLEGRVAKNEAAVAKMAKREKEKERESGRSLHSSRNGCGSSGRSRRVSSEHHHHHHHDDVEEEEDKERERMRGQLQSLQRKLKTLGDSTSRACRSLSVGVTDAQNATLQLFSWADKVHIAFDHVSKDCLKLSKNILPRAKLLELSSTAPTSTGGAAGRARSGGGQTRRSVSAGGGGDRKKRSQSLEHSSGGGVDSDYEIHF